LKKLPRSPFLLSNLGFLIATCPDASLRDLPEATRLAERACELTHYHTSVFLSTLGVIYSQDGRFSEAILMTEKSSALVVGTADSSLIQKNNQLLDLYRADRPFHESLHP
jgi:hypothetical protein